MHEENVEGSAVISNSINGFIRQPPECHWELSSAFRVRHIPKIVDFEISFGSSVEPPEHVNGVVAKITNFILKCGHCFCARATGIPMEKLILVFGTTRARTWNPGGNFWLSVECIV